MKRLLLLGGGSFTKEILDYKNKRDVELFAAGKSINPALENIVSKTFIIDTTDSKAMLGLIKENNIDGVFLGGNEDNITASFDYLEILNLPSYLNRKTWSIASNKDLFKKECAKIGIPTPFEIDINKINKHSKFPVVIKPVDSCGSKGVQLCKSFDDFKKKAKYSLLFSRTQTLLVEEYLSGTEISVHYTIKDGVAKLSSMSDKYESTHCGDFNPIPDCYCYPSVYLQEYLTKYDQKMKQLFKQMGINKGIVFVQGFYCEKDFKFFEMGYRIPGTYTFKYSKYLNDISALDLLLDYSVGISPNDFEIQKENAQFRKYCCTLTLLSKGGHICKVIGVDEIKKDKNIICVEERYSLGDVVQVTNSLGQAHIWIYIAASTVFELKRTIENVNKTISVLDDGGHDILYHDFDCNRLLFK